MMIYYSESQRCLQYHYLSISPLLNQFVIKKVCKRERERERIAEDARNFLVKSEPLEEMEVDSSAPVAMTTSTTREITPSQLFAPTEVNSYLTAIAT